MACNHHDFGRRCNRPTGGAPYCTLHADLPADPEVVLETTSSSEFSREVVPEDDTPHPDTPLTRTPVCLHVEDNGRCQNPVDGTDFCDLHTPEPDDSEVAPETTSSSEFRCVAAKADGTPCDAAPHAGTAFCIFHDPGYKEQRLQNSANGGRRKYGPRAVRYMDSIYVDTQTAAGIQAVITAVVGLELTGQINPVRSRNILRALSVAARNIHMNRGVNVEEYSSYLTPLCETLDDSIAAAWENDAPPPKPPKLPLPLPSPRSRLSGPRTSYASASDYLNRLAAQYLNADD